MVTRRTFLATAALAALACATPEPRVLVIPEAMRRPPPAPPSAVTPASAASPAAVAAASQKYVLRLAESGRVWELELPEGAGGYEVKVPLAGTGPAEMLTSADEEILADATATGSARAERGGGPAGAETRPASLDARTAAARKSYLGGLAKVSELYRSRKFELALVEVVNLEGAFPKDGRILAMKGSLYVKLGKKRLARDAWQKALSLNPSDAGVAEALRELGEGED